MAAPRVERGRLALDGQFWGLSNGWSATLLAIPDPFLYAESDGRQYVMASSFELGRINDVAPHLEALPYEEFGIDELYAQGLTREEIELEILLRAVRSFGVADAAVPAAFPLELADHLRENGIEVKADRRRFVERRRVKNEAELAGIRRALRASCCARPSGRTAACCWRASSSPASA